MRCRHTAITPNQKDYGPLRAFAHRQNLRRLHDKFSSDRCGGFMGCADPFRLSTAIFFSKSASKASCGRDGASCPASRRERRRWNPDLHRLQVTFARLVQFVRRHTVAQHALQFLDGTDRRRARFCGLTMAEMVKLARRSWDDTPRLDVPVGQPSFWRMRTPSRDESVAQRENVIGHRQRWIARVVIAQREQ